MIMSTGKSWGREHSQKMVKCSAPKELPDNTATGNNVGRALSLFSRFNYDPSVSVPPRHYPDAEVDGRNRYQFFRRPIIPFLPQMPPNVVLAPTR